jgi:hypothetical protein
MEASEEWDVNFKRVTVKMSDGLVVQGKVNIRAFPRLSDFFRGTDDRFVVVVSDQDQPQKVMMLHKDYIIWAEAVD